MKPFIISFLFILSSVAFAQQLDDKALTVRVDPVLGKATSGGALASYPLPLPIFSVHVGYSHYATAFDSEDPTGWLDLGFSVHSPRVSQGLNLGALVLYSLGLRDGSGHKIVVTPMGQFKTSDDNLLTASLHIEAGTVDLQMSPLLDWQWCWTHLFFGPRLGYAFTQSKPILGGTLGYRW